MSHHRIVSRKEALELIMGSVRPLETIKLPLDDALGCVAAENLYAPGDLPRFNCSAMDGYAIKTEDTTNATNEYPARLKVVGEIRASTEHLTPVEKGQAVRIMTGGPIPPGADAVVKEEDVRPGPASIEVPEKISPFQHVWQRGKGLKTGSLIVEQGSPVTPATIGTLTSLQIKEVAVTRKPDVCIIAVGNELIDINEEVRGHKIVASNIYMLSATVKEIGCRLTWAKISKNDNDTIRKHVLEGLKSDVLIATGGSSRAHADLTRTLLEEMGIDLRFAGVSMRPGKGTSFGLYNNKPVFCLPGTPSAVHVVSYTLVVPALTRLMGFSVNTTCVVEAILEQDINKRPGIEHLVQGLVRKQDSRHSVLPLVGTDVEVFRAMAEANALILVDPEKTRLKRGETVQAQLLNTLDPSLPRTSGGQWSSIPRGKDAIPPIISIVGKSDAGKTTLLERLVPELRARGYRIGTIKHDMHGFDIDHEGKDSWRHKQAGASTVVISSPKKVALVKDVETEETLDGLASKYFRDVDIILTEGYKKEDKPKVEVFRSQVHKAPLCKGDKNLVAFVSDTSLDLGVPHFELDDIKGLADLLEKRFLIKSSQVIR